MPFTTYTMRAYAASWHHRVLAATLDRFALREIRRLMVFMPPQHGKSELVSRRLPAKILGDKPAARIIAASYAADLSSRMNRDVQKIMDDEPYARLYPHTRLGGKNVRTVAGPQPLRNSDEFEIVGADDRLTGGSYKSAGVCMGITGRPMDFGIIDDPIKGREDAESAAMRENVWGWYHGDFMSRSHNDTCVLLTCTRWHPDDLAGRLLKAAVDDPKADQWEVICFPAIRDSLDDARDPRQLGEALWPERHSLASLEGKRAGSPYDWASIYMQNPRGAGTREWPDEYFPSSMWFDDWPADLAHMTRVLALDPSKGKSDKSGDYSAWVKLAVEHCNPPVLWVDADLSNTRPIEPSQSNPDMPSTVGDGYNHLVTFRPQAILIETNGFQEMVASAFLRYCTQRQTHAPVFTICNTVPKVQRIRGLGPYLAQRRIRVRNTPGGRLLVQQMRDFPVGEHDDGPDAVQLSEVMADHVINGGGNMNVLGA